MKKIFTLLFAAVLVSAAAFAQDGRHGNYNDSRHYNSWQQQYPSVNGYGYSNPYGGGYSKSYGYDNEFGRANIYDRRRQWKEREYERMMRRRMLNERLYRTNRTGLSLQVTIGGHRPLY